MKLAYNPALLDIDELVRSFVARGELLELILGDLRENRRVHRLLLGQRGMGKTTLLRRVAAEVARDPVLTQRWMALTFPEEQYNVVTLSDFWANCLDAAADSLQAAGDRAGAERIDEALASLPSEEDARAAYALEHLRALANAGKRLLLCVDNLQQVLGRLREHEQWALRRVLSETDALALLAASPALPEPAADYGAAFYDFLQLTRLDALDFDAAIRMLDALAMQVDAPAVRAVVQSRPARLHSLHVLAGGNPRTLVMLFDLLKASPGEDTQRLLELLVDRATPLYKARFEELAEQAQVVLGALALHWHPATAAQLAEATRLDVNTVSTQLSRLHRDGLVLKVEIAGEARTGFLVAERFFNIWYLMRASRRLRGRVLGFARCLEAIYDEDGLRVLALRALQTPVEPDWTAALSTVVRDLSLKRALVSTIPTADVAELVAEPDDLRYRERVDANRRWHDLVAPGVASLELEDTTLNREEMLVATTRLVRGEPAAKQHRFFELALSLHELRHAVGSHVVEGMASALRLGLLPVLGWPSVAPDEVQAAALRVGCPGLFPWWESVVTGDVTLAPLLECNDPALMHFLAERTTNPILPIERAIGLLLGPTANPDGTRRWRMLTGLCKSAIKHDRLDLCLRSLEAALDWPHGAPLSDARATSAAGLFGSVPRPIQARLLAATLASEVSPTHALSALPPTIVDYWEVAVAVLLAQDFLTSNSTSALKDLASRCRSGSLPLAIAIDVALAKDAGLLSRYAPEVQTAARKLLDDFWPKHIQEQPEPQRSTARKGTRRARRP